MLAPWFDELIKAAEWKLRNLSIEIHDVHFLRQDPLSTRGSHFGWHIDEHGAETPLVMSMIILLRKTNSKKDYAINFLPDNTEYEFTNVGDGVIFSSGIPHITVPGSGVCLKVALFFKDIVKGRETKE